MGYYSAIKNEMTFAATCIDLEIVILSEGSLKKGEISYDIPYIWNLERNYTNELTKQKETHGLRNNLMVAGVVGEAQGKG